MQSRFVDLPLDSLIWPYAIQSSLIWPYAIQSFCTMCIRVCSCYIYIDIHFYVSSSVLVGKPTLQLAPYQSIDHPTPPYHDIRLHIFGTSKSCSPASSVLHTKQPTCVTKLSCFRARSVLEADLSAGSDTYSYVGNRIALHSLGTY
jgi:hypothetical protein